MFLQRLDFSRTFCSPVAISKTLGIQLFLIINSLALFPFSLPQTWMLYQGGRALEVLDPSLTKCNRDEAAMCIQLGLLCCQSSIMDRPDMNSVHLMLSSDSFTLPTPTKPGIQGRVGRWTTTSTSALTNTNASSGFTGGTKASASGSTIVEEYSRNSMSVSSIDEGR